MASSVKFEWDSTEFDAKIAALEPKITERIRSRVRRAATKAEETMKRDGPWTQTGFKNRWGRVSTGEAREGLYAKATTQGSMGTGGFKHYAIEFGNLAEHGKWLEIAMSGRFAIIGPTMRATADVLIRSMNGLLTDANEAGEVANIVPSLSYAPGAPSPSKAAGTAAYTPARTARRRDSRGRFVKGE